MINQLQKLSHAARKLLDVIIEQARNGPLSPKAKDTTTPVEILEACGLDVGEFYTLLDILKDAGLIRVTNAYPFEEIQLTAQAAKLYRDL